MDNTLHSNEHPRWTFTRVRRYKGAHEQLLQPGRPSTVRHQQLDVLHDQPERGSFLSHRTPPRVGTARRSQWIVDKARFATKSSIARGPRGRGGGGAWGGTRSAGPAAGRPAARRPRWPRSAAAGRRAASTPATGGSVRKSLSNITPLYGPARIAENAVHWGGKGGSGGPAAWWTLKCHATDLQPVVGAGVDAARPRVEHDLAPRPPLSESAGAPLMRFPRAALSERAADRRGR